MSIRIKHNSGFFSCCSVRLDCIIDHFNRNKKLPKFVDSSKQFKWYKIDILNDVTFDYFTNYNNVDLNIEYSELIDYKDVYQFKDYTKLNLNKIIPFIKKYFCPSEQILNMIEYIEKKYSLDYKNICALFYRGNDKNTETKVCDYDEYIEKANIIVKKNPNIKFLIQSDETEFIKKMLSLFPKNSFYFKDEIRHMNKCNNTVDICMKDNIILFSKYFLAITIIMSKCEYLICGSGNCSIWIIFYRENCKNIIQNLNGEWFENLE